MDELVKAIREEFNAHHTLPNYYDISFKEQKLLASKKDCLLIALKDKRLTSITKKPSFLMVFYPDRGVLKVKQIDTLAINPKVVVSIMKPMIIKHRYSSSNAFNKLKNASRVNKRKEN